MGKRFAALLLAFLLIMPLAACQGQKPSGPLRICLDIWTMRDYGKLESKVNTFLELVAEKGGPSEVEVEYIPSEDGEERQGALTRLRAEIMGGNGPDLFIIRDGDYEGQLFTYPEKSMENNLFLPLDEYMEKSQFTQWDKQNQTILNAGRTEKGQMIIPLAYQVPVTCFRKSDVSQIPDAGLTWMDLANSSDPVEQITTSFQGGCEKRIAGCGSPELTGALGKLADYDKEELLFTEEDLWAVMDKKQALGEAEDSGEYNDIPDFFQTWLMPRFDGMGSGMMLTTTIERTEPLTVIPQHSRNGGVTATITSYAAVNAGTKHKEDAFFILDLLLSREVQQRSEFYTNYLAASASYGGAPMDMELLSEDYPMIMSADAGMASQASLTPENFEAYCAARDAVTQVNFRDALERSLEDLHLRCDMIRTGYAEGDVDKEISETYRVMGMSIKES